MYATEDKLDKGTDSLLSVIQWIKRRSNKEKLGMGVAAGILVGLRIWCRVKGVALGNFHPMVDHRRPRYVVLNF